MPMSLSSEDLQVLGQYVRSQLPEWIAEIRAPQWEADISERLTRVELEVRASKELMLARFEAVDERFVAMDSRFDSMQKQMDERFTAMDSRFFSMQKQMDERFTAVDSRFEAVNARFEAINGRFNSLQWFMGVGMTLLFAALTAVIAVFAG